MNALQFVASLRMQDIKPASVWIDAVPAKPFPAWFSGSVHAEIGDDESVSDMDFRPLVGLTVHLGARGSRQERVRRLAKRVAEAKPALLCVYSDEGGKFVMHRLWADGRSDRSST